MRRRTFMAASVMGVLPLAGPADALNGQAAVQEHLGVYKGAGCDGRAALTGYVNWLGRRPGWIIDFLAQETWYTFHRSAVWIGGCWRGDDAHLSLAVPMLTQDGRTNLAHGAAGAYDSHFRQLAQTLVATGRADAVLRLGWEFNGKWSTWCPAHNPESFVTYWRRIVATMRAMPGARFRFDWNPTLGRAAIDSQAVYPGDDVVDVIGLDVYNQSWTVPRLSPQDRWSELRQQPYGLDWHRSFAQSKGKKRSFPEWGTGRRPDGSGGGDDPLFVTEMAQWVEEPDVLYYGYWDYPASDYYGILSTGQFPRAAATFRARFGHSAPIR